MSEEKEMKEEINHQPNEEQELTSLDKNSEQHSQKAKTFIGWIAAVVIIGLIGIVGLFIINNKNSATTITAQKTEVKEEDGHSEDEEGREVKLSSEALNSAGIQTEGVTLRPAIAKLFVTGTVELNPEKTEMATPLVGGRLEKVFYGVGDFVQQGAVLATISSPQLAQMHGKLHEARTRYELAQRNLERVQKSENRVAVLQAKAKLEESEANLKRTKRLIELGAGAGKDLISAEAAYKTAKADYDFQSNISLNKEIQEAKAEVETSQVDLHHIQDEMRSLGVYVDISKEQNHNIDTSLVSIKAPLSGIITERKFNAGAGIEAAQPVFVISNLSTIYVIANTPESVLSELSVGSIAEIKSTVVGTLNGRISYIDPRLDETTRTGRVRLEVPNSNGKLRAGMFTEVGFQTGTNESAGEELAVNSEAIQREGDKTIVFIPKDDEPGAFEVREIQIGGEFEGYTTIKGGLKLGEKVVTKGSFTLKTQMQKGEMGDHGH